MEKIFEALKDFQNKLDYCFRDSPDKGWYDGYIDGLQQVLQRLEEVDKAIAICKKANEQKYVYIKASYGITKEEFLDNLDYEILNNRLYLNSRGVYYDFPLKDYGNWWALTKEELEND